MRNLGSKLGRLPARLRLCRRELCGALLCGTDLGASLCFGLKVSSFGLGLRFGRLMAQSGRLPPRLLELLRPSAALIGTHRHSSAIRAIHGGPWAIQGIRRPPWPSMAIDGIRRHTWRSGVISRHSPPRYARASAPSPPPWPPPWPPWPPPPPQPWPRRRRRRPPRRSHDSSRSRSSRGAPDEHAIRAHHQGQSRAIQCHEGSSVDYLIGRRRRLACRTEAERLVPLGFPTVGHPLALLCRTLSLAQLPT